MNKEDKPGELLRGQASNAFSRWVLPRFDEPDIEEEEAAPPEDELESVESFGSELDDEALLEYIDDEEIKPLSLEELEQIRQQAYQEAYNEGFATGEREGFHSGQLKAHQEAEQALAPQLRQLERLMQQLMEPLAGQDQALEQMLLELVVHLVREVIRRELSIDSSQIVPVVREALKLLPMGAGNIRIHLHPQDFELIRALRERHEEQWRILEDEQLLPGGCRIETEHSQIDASVETRLVHAINQLLEQQQEQAAHPPAPDLIQDLAEEPPHAS